MSCTLCDGKENSIIFEAKNMPALQNVTYENTQDAKAAPSGDISLMLCHQCGLVSNSTFQFSDLEFDPKYENEQGHSDFYNKYLSSIIDLFTSHNFLKNKIVEIGCGKGFFLEKLNEAGFDCMGFDPIYEGYNPKIIKDYFTKENANISADVIVLRHMLAHQKNPLEFLHMIAEAVDYQGKVYIELASFDWMLKEGAFWDIYYENCNYFTRETLRGMFSESETGELFGGQCQYLIADLQHLKFKCETNSKVNNYLIQSANLNNFKIKCEKHLNNFKNIALWGASGKGVSFANFIDPNHERISFLVDINRKKHGRYISKTSHKIISPYELDRDEQLTILVMNNNYFKEIQQMISEYNINLITIENLLNGKTENFIVENENFSHNNLTGVY